METNNLLNIQTLGESENYILHLRPAFVVFIDVIRCLMFTIQPVHDFIRTRTCFVVIIFPVQPAYMPTAALGYWPDRNAIYHCRQVLMVAAEMEIEF